MTVNVDGLSPRDTLVAVLTAEFPQWRVVPVERATDVLDRPMIVVKQRTVGVLPEAPLGQFLVSFYVTLVDEHTSSDKAEPALDDNVLAVWSVLQAGRSTHPKTASKVNWDDQHIAYDIETDVWVAITKEQS